MSAKRDHDFDQSLVNGLEEDDPGDIVTGDDVYITLLESDDPTQGQLFDTLPKQ